MNLAAPGARTKRYRDRDPRNPSPPTPTHRRGGVVRAAGSPCLRSALCGSQRPLCLCTSSAQRSANQRPVTSAPRAREAEDGGARRRQRHQKPAPRGEAAGLLQDRTPGAVLPPHSHPTAEHCTLSLCCIVLVGPCVPSAVILAQRRTEQHFCLPPLQYYTRELRTV